MVILLGSQFALAEFVGAPVMIVILTELFRLFLKPAMVDQARAQAEKGLHGKCPGADVAAIDPSSDHPESENGRNQHLMFRVRSATAGPRINERPAR